MLAIAITGNFGFFNFLTATLGLSLIDDGHVMGLYQLFGYHAISIEPQSNPAHLQSNSADDKHSVISQSNQFQSNPAQRQSNDDVLTGTVTTTTEVTSHHSTSHKGIEVVIDDINNVESAIEVAAITATDASATTTATTTATATSTGAADATADATLTPITSTTSTPPPPPPPSSTNSVHPFLRSIEEGSDNFFAFLAGRTDLSTCHYPLRILTPTITLLVTITTTITPIITSITTLTVTPLNYYHFFSTGYGWGGNHPVHLDPANLLLNYPSLQHTNATATVSSLEGDGGEATLLQEGGGEVTSLEGSGGGVAADKSHVDNDAMVLKIKALVEGSDAYDDKSTMMTIAATKKQMAMAGVEIYVSTLIDQMKARIKEGGVEKGIGMEVGVGVGLGSDTEMAISPKSSSPPPRAYSSFVRHLTNSAFQKTLNHADKDYQGANHHNYDNDGDIDSNTSLHSTSFGDDDDNTPPPSRSIGQWVMVSINSVQVALALSLALLVGIGDTPSPPLV